MSNRNLKGEARIALADGERVIAQVCAHLAEHGAAISEDPGQRLVEFAHSSARFTWDTDAATVAVSADDAEHLYFIRMAVASHVLEFAAGPAPEIQWHGDGGDLARPPNFQILTVREIADITPHMRRIIFSAPNAARFASLSALHVKILIQHPDAHEPQWPRIGANGLAQWDEPEFQPVLRKYTIRALDLTAGTLTIDFVLHDDAGPGAAFAERAKPGDELGIFGPGGGGLVAADWYLFAGDATALPAIGRMLEHLPGGARGKALIEVTSAAEIQDLRTEAAIDIQWLIGNRLADAVRAVPFPEDGSSLYVWAGCEFDDFRAIRSYLRKERGLTKQQHLVVSYWRRGAVENDD